jgi:hypothetical protein
MNNLIIIGNGFDLAHGLKTSYNDFIEYLINNTMKKKTFSSLISDRFYVKDYQSLIWQLRSNSSQVSDFKNKFIGILLKEISTNNWCDIESKYFEILSQIGKNNTYHSSYSSYSDLNKDFSYLRKSLSEYLDTQIKPDHPIKSYENLFAILNSNETKILNFNYTKTVQELYLKPTHKSKIIHIHGEIDNPRNPIIFGYAATHSESRKLMAEGDNEKMRYIKKNLYKRAENEYLLSSYLENTKDIDISILGHSCGISDNLILNQILNHENVKSINIYYYKDENKDPEGEEHFFQTQVNIDRIMTDDKRFRELLTDQNRSTRMPQIGDNELQIEEFTKFIHELKQKQTIEKDTIGKQAVANHLRGQIEKLNN